MIIGTAAGFFLPCTKHQCMICYKQLPAILFLSLLTACGNGLEEGSAKTQTTTTPPPVTIQPATQQQTAPAATTTNTAGLNPAHGQPGHRCDIQVGAPLNSAPAATTTATPPQQQTISLPPAATAPVTTTAAGKNPPHGQPGHRCDIAVGAPLPK
jgi:hypothetical protein